MYSVKVYHNGIYELNKFLSTGKNTLEHTLFHKLHSGELFARHSNLHLDEH